jgi:hypothetical protein
MVWNINIDQARYLVYNTALKEDCRSKKTISLARKTAIILVELRLTPLFRLLELFLIG